VELRKQQRALWHEANTYDNFNIRRGKGLRPGVRPLRAEKTSHVEGGGGGES